MQTASDQDPSDVPNKFIDQNAQRVSYCSTINWASRNSPQHNQVRSNTKRTEIRREMERIGRTYFTLTAFSACFLSTLLCHGFKSDVHQSTWYLVGWDRNSIRHKTGFIYSGLVVLSGQFNDQKRLSRDHSTSHANWKTHFKRREPS